MAVAVNLFSDDICVCIQERKNSPLIVYPRSTINFIQWSQEHQQEVAEAIKQYGVIVFSGFGLTKENFHDALTAATGMPPQIYKGDTPRNEVGSNIYQSTAVAGGQTIPLHQEVSAGDRRDMPQYISFFCVTPPEKGTGQTLVGNAKNVSLAIQAAMPDLWKCMSTHTLTYTARYLPKDSLRTRWIQWLNPSHATIEKRFGTEKKEEVEKKCRQEGLTCRWDGGWAVVSRSNVPATINREGVTLFCNQIHVDRFNPKLCGGWLNYIFARLFLYPTSGSMQFDVEFDDGTQISRNDASKLLSILEEHQVGRDWKKGDLMILDNVATMHAKTSHTGNREILVAMNGTIIE